MANKMNLVAVIKRFNKFNHMEFNKDHAESMAKVLVERFGFTDKKYYSHIDRELQMFDWNSCDGTLFGYLDGNYGKIELGRAFDSEHGWFCADFI